MAYVIKNITPHVVTVDGVKIDPGQQLTIQFLSGPISAALDNGLLHLADGDETREERHAMVEAIGRFQLARPFSISYSASKTNHITATPSLPAHAIWLASFKPPGF